MSYLKKLFCFCIITSTAFILSCSDLQKSLPTNFIPSDYINLAFFEFNDDGKMNTLAEWDHKVYTEHEPIQLCVGVRGMDTVLHNFFLGFKYDFNTTKIEVSGKWQFKVESDAGVHPGFKPITYSWTYTPKPEFFTKTQLSYQALSEQTLMRHEVFSSSEEENTKAYRCTYINDQNNYLTRGSYKITGSLVLDFINKEEGPDYGKEFTIPLTVSNYMLIEKPKPDSKLSMDPYLSNDNFVFKQDHTLDSNSYTSLNPMTIVNSDVEPLKWEIEFFEDGSDTPTDTFTYQNAVTTSHNNHIQACSEIFNSSLQAYESFCYNDKVHFKVRDWNKVKTDSLYKLILTGKTLNTGHTKVFTHLFKPTKL